MGWVSASCDTLVTTLPKGSEGRSWEQHGAIAMSGSPESRQQPCLPPADLAMALEKSLPFSLSFGSKWTRQLGVVCFHTQKRMESSPWNPFSAVCVCVRARMYSCGYKYCVCCLPPLLDLLLFWFVQFFIMCCLQGPSFSAICLPHTWPSFLCTGLDTGWDEYPTSTHLQ